MKVLVFIVFAIYAASLCFPIIWAFLMSMMSRAEFNSVSGGFKLPSTFSLANYVKVWKELDTNGYSMLTMVTNSIWYAVGGALILTVPCAMNAYVIAKYDFPGKKIFKFYQWFILTVPIMGTMSSALRFFRTLGVYDSPLYVLACVTGSGAIYLYFLAAFRSLSWEYAESAFIDGAGHFRTFFQIMLPQVRPVMIALFVDNFIDLWNDSGSPLIYFPSMPTLSMGLYVYQTVTARSINYPLLFAALIISLIPTLALFFKFSNNLMSLNLGGGIKG